MIAPNVVGVDAILKWNLASWKVKGIVLVPPIPESLDYIKSRIKTAISSVTAMLPFCREFGGHFKDAWSSQSIKKDVGLSILNSNFCFFIFFLCFQHNFIKFKTFINIYIITVRFLLNYIKITLAFSMYKWN